MQAEYLDTNAFHSFLNQVAPSKRSLRRWQKQGKAKIGGRKFNLNSKRIGTCWAIPKDEARVIYWALSRLAVERKSDERS